MPKKVDPAAAVDAAPADVVHLTDQIDFQRKVAIPTEDAIPKAPAEYESFNSSELSRLRKIGGDNIAEAVAAIQEIVDDPKQYRADFGPKAPDPALAVHLGRRFSIVSAAVARTESLLAFLKSVENVAVHDIAVFLDKVREDFDYAQKKDSNVASNHKKLGAYFAGVSKAISDGIAHAKALKEASKQPK